MCATPRKVCGVDSADWETGQPRGALVGEDRPVENERREIDRGEIDRGEIDRGKRDDERAARRPRTSSPPGS